MAEADLRLTSEECPCVGSMGLHQNNLLSSNAEYSSSPGGQFSALSLTINQLKSRSMVDVFRDIRDRYFGRPELNVNPSKDSQKKISTESIEQDEDGTSESLESLPIYCKLMILSFLDTQDVCTMSLLNSHWREVANDQFLWRELLIRDMCKWESMSNKSHPLISQVWNNDVFCKSNGSDFYEILHGLNGSVGEIHSSVPESNIARRRSKGVNFKALYIHSSFQRVQDDADTPSNHVGLPNFIKSLWQGSDSLGQGEIIMTGPGMDSPRTSGIFRSLMWENGFLETKRLLAGNRDGIGSGVQVLFKEKIQFNLVALYSGNNRVRETRTGMERLIHSNVIEAVQNDQNNEDNENAREATTEFALYEAVRFYIAERKGLYKLIYVVDASANQKWEDVSCNKMELQAVLKGTEFDSNIAAAVGHDVHHELMGLDGDVIEEQHSNTQGNRNQLFGKRPLLVLSCVEDPSVPRFSCIQITAMLGLPSIKDRQWRVQDVIVSNMHGVEKGLKWLLQQS